VIYQLIDEEKAHHSVSRMSQLLGVSRQGYYQHVRRAPTDPYPHERSDQELNERIGHHQSRGICGASGSRLTWPRSTDCERAVTASVV